MTHDRIDTRDDQQSVGELFRRESVQRVGQAGELLHQAVTFVGELGVEARGVRSAMQALTPRSAQ